MEANQECAGSARTVTWISDRSIESTCHSCANVSWISRWVTRRGPHPGGSSSLKQSMKYWPPGRTACKARNERCPVLVVEHMKEATVEDGVELLSKALELSCIPHDEARRRAALIGLRFGQPDRLGGEVDPDYVASRLSRHQRMLSGATTNIEHSTSQAAVGDERRECGLWPTDVPGRRRLVRSFELGCKISAPGLLFAHRSCLHRPTRSIASARPTRRSCAPTGDSGRSGVG